MAKHLEYYNFSGSIGFNLLKKKKLVKNIIWSKKYLKYQKF